MKVLRKSDLKKQSYPPPEILRDIERSLKPAEVKQGMFHSPVDFLEETESAKSKDKSAAETEEMKHDEPTETVLHPKEVESTKPVPPSMEENVTTPSTGSSSARRRKGRPGAGDILLEKVY